MFAININEYALTVRTVKINNHALKFFRVSLPIRIESIAMVALYKEASLDINDLCQLMLLLLKPVRPDTLLEQLSLSEIKSVYENYPLEVSWDDLVSQFQFVINQLRTTLIELEIYHGCDLTFNSVWFEDCETICFFRTDKCDIEYPRPVMISERYRRGKSK